MEKYLKRSSQVLSARLSGALPNFLMTKNAHQPALRTLEDKLRALVEIPTITGQFEPTHTALTMVARFLRQRGMHTTWQTYEGFECFVATTRPTKTPKVYLYAHADVVTAPADMFVLQKENGNYIGRGVYDMKVSLAAYMQVVDDLQGSLHEYDFGIMVTSDEELGKKGKNSNDSCFNRLLGDGYLGKVYVMPDGGREWQLETSAKGFMHYILTAHGKAAHGSRPWEGENAINKLMDALADLRIHFKDHGPGTDTLNIAMLNGGEVVNRIPNKARAELDIRLSNSNSRARIIAIVENTCRLHHIEHALHVDVPLVFNDLANPYLVSFAESIKKVVDMDVTGVTSLGTSDARFLMAYNLPAAVFYPFGGGHHSNEEWLPESEPERLRDVIADYLNKVAHTP